MEITARLTADAKVRILSDEKQVVNFSVAINDSYKPKGSSEVKQLTAFIQCAYWINSGIVKHLTKGTLVQLYGRLGVNVYKDMQGEPKAAITFHVVNIKLLGKGRVAELENIAVASASELPRPQKTSHFKQTGNCIS